ncbi:MAG: DUF3990 domain-containing protein [Muribaculaceae bacterium]|nr:DUF3990 domain-containing protein [Muribaculaceae bacterium]
MKLFHGSNQYINQVDLTKSRPFKDFGQGFYLSDDENQAIQLAKIKTAISGGEPCVSSFEFDKDGLFESDLNIKIFEDYSEEWVEFIILNREGANESTHDFVYGPIADDKVGLQLRQFKNGSIDKSSLIERLKYTKGITFQYFFGTTRALKYLKRV